MNLLDICKIGGSSVKKFDGEKKYIATGDIIENEILSYEMVDYNSKPSRANVEIKKNDVIFAKMMDTIKVLKANDNNVSNIYSTGFYCMTPNDNVLQDYLYYYFKSNTFNSQKNKNCSGATQKAINNEGLKKISIKFLPNIEEQNKIVKQLCNLENLIGIKKEEINKLELLIKSQFVEMFKDEEKYPKEYLKDNVLEMFIGPFGSALKNECFVDESESSCVVYEQKHAINKYLGEFRYVDVNKHNELKRFEILPNDIIVSCRGTIGETYVIPDNAPLGIMHPSIMKIRLDLEKYNPVFFNEVIKQYLSDNINMTKGGTIKMGIKATDLGNTKFIRPELKDQVRFLNIKNQIDKQKFEFENSLKKLEELQASLMQEYFG